jgi:hypothetical protein
MQNSVKTSELLKYRVTHCVPERTEAIIKVSGYGGLEVVFWPLVPAGSHPAEANGFLGVKKSSARLPFGGEE